MIIVRTIDVDDYEITVFYTYSSSIDLEQVVIGEGNVLPILSIDFINKIIKKLEQIEEKEARYGHSMTRMSDYR
jgi:hypothetical protein